MATFNVSLHDLMALAAAYRSESIELRSRSAKLLHITYPLVQDWPRSSPLGELVENVQSSQRQLADSLERMAEVLEKAALALQSANESLTRVLEL